MPTRFCLPMCARRKWSPARGGRRFLSSSSRLADQVFHNDANSPEWGLLDDAAWAYPPYYVLWMWNNSCRQAAREYSQRRSAARRASNDVVVVAANTLYRTRVSGEHARSQHRR
jgi:hypothetical protein